MSVVYCAFILFFLFILKGADTEKVRLSPARGPSAERVYVPLLLILSILLLVFIYILPLPGITSMNGVEARAGMEAAFLSKNGVDSTGIWPAMARYSTLYAAILRPLEAAFGISPALLHAPAICLRILALLSLALMAARRLGGKRAVSVLFFLGAGAACLSGTVTTEAGLMLSVFLIGASALGMALLTPKPGMLWFFLSMVLFGISVYTHPMALSFNALFLTLFFALLLRKKQLSIPACIFGMAVFLVIALPAILSAAARTFGLDMTWGPFTISGSTMVQEMHASPEPESLSKGLLQGIARALEAPPLVFSVWALGEILLVSGSRRASGSQKTLYIMLSAWLPAAIFTLGQAGNHFEMALCPLLILLAIRAAEAAQNGKAGVLLAVIPLYVAVMALLAPMAGQSLTAEEQTRNGLYRALTDSYRMDYDEYYIGADDEKMEEAIWPQLMLAHGIDYAAWQEETDLLDAEGEHTDWYYTERYFFLSDPEAFEPDPMACSVYVMPKTWQGYFSEEEYLLYDYEDYFVAYPQYWAEE